MNEFEKQLASQRLKTIPPEWRAEILGAAQRTARRDASTTETPRLQPLHWLRELLWPCPQAWAALAGVWIVIAVVQHATPGASPGMNTAVAKAPVTSVIEQRRELARAIEAASGKLEPSPADRPRGARKIDYAFA